MERFKYHLLIIAVWILKKITACPSKDSGYFNA